ncbi:ATP-binding protein [Rhizohabitans arisaemae]|uniref:ATP-binding protein n=1 Tax=Rhizohabitans arisaemae TaxID=2720610 RepID=UPI0024B201E4|nr:ATP-binding protein [Rhizohabitans arisaemae]
MTAHLAPGGAGKAIRGEAPGWLLAALELDYLPRGSPRHDVPAPARVFSDRLTPDVVTCDLAPEAVSARASREFTKETLRGWNLQDLYGDAQLVVSELVTNALRYGLREADRLPGDRPIQLRLLQMRSQMACAVRDLTADAPIMASDFAETGRGLHLVDALTARWGWTPHGLRGKIVWALFEPSFA